MVVNMFNSTAGRSNSAGGHNLHFSNRWHEFCSTCKFWHFTCNRWHEFWSLCKFWHHFTSSSSLMIGTCKFWNQNRWHEYFHLVPIPTQASPKEWPQTHGKREKIFKCSDAQSLYLHVIYVYLLTFKMCRSAQDFNWEAWITYMDAKIQKFISMREQI